MPKLKNRPPSYRLHRASGQAIVTLFGRDHYLGRYGSAESHAKYQQIVARWAAMKHSPELSTKVEGIPTEDLRVGELITAYLEYAEQYYRKNGKPTGECENVRLALLPARKLYERSRVSEFGPVALKTVRQAMIDARLARSLVNARVNRVRRMFKWGVENQLVEPSVLQALQAVAPLKKGRSEAAETADVEPVPQDAIDAVRPLVSRQVRTMIDLQLLTGMRPGEVVLMRPGDIDRTASTWKYRPATHKTEHHGVERSVYLGPKAQRLIAPYLNREPEAYLFSPQEAMQERKLARRQRAKTKYLSPLKAKPNPKLGTCYTRNAYHNAIFKACQKAKITPWGPNRLRHNAATLLRKEYGIEAARVILGHRSAEVTEVYAELDRNQAAEIMAAIG